MGRDLQLTKWEVKTWAEGHKKGCFSSRGGWTEFCQDLMPVDGMNSCEFQEGMSSGALWCRILE